MTCLSFLISPSALVVVVRLPTPAMQALRDLRARHLGTSCPGLATRHMRAKLETAVPRETRALPLSEARREAIQTSRCV